MAFLLTVRNIIQFSSFDLLKCISYYYMTDNEIENHITLSLAKYKSISIL